MEAIQYTVTTLSATFTKLLPYFIFLGGGYFIFIKLPFLLFRKSMDHQKKHLEEEPGPVQEKLKVVGGPKKEHAKRESGPKEKSSRAERALGLSPEEVLGFKRGQVIDQTTLKKRYFEKLKENHPDRVASMGEDFKRLAEKNTKEINEAYSKLKKRAA